ncbi:hypothetical protein WEU38_07550 [Cyanobacterium aponinum AL20118]|uniref:Uncharacterized protein n=1 Tax=Cyanobacterium aponinum AL20115 TaxID=3090662 RepID=A0AAF0ZGN0_9CHRO|nr:hypothetical protein [Cyanobacterium aponinum]WPF90118.1 hypothetical protein SAY89_07570 [Cyanobacterium aponinum AL20115]
MIQKQTILLITSTIQPSLNTYLLKITDPEERLKDYEKAFYFYCSLIKSCIVSAIIYCDNSGYDLSSLKKIAEELEVLSTVEFISYKSSIDTINNGRFYLEINLVKYCLDNFLFIKHSPLATIYKVTGRYIIANIKKIISPWKNNNFDWFCNCRNYPYKWTDFYLVGFTVQSFKKIISETMSLYEGKKDGEIILREYLDSLKNSDLKIVKRFPVTPLIKGRRGYDGGYYGQGKDYIKYIFRSITNYVLPFIWL